MIPALITLSIKSMTYEDLIYVGQVYRGVMTIDLYNDVVYRIHYIIVMKSREYRSQYRITRINTYKRRCVILDSLLRGMSEHLNRCKKYSSRHQSFYLSLNQHQYGAYMCSSLPHRFFQSIYHLRQIMPIFLIPFRNNKRTMTIDFGAYSWIRPYYKTNCSRKNIIIRGGHSNQINTNFKPLRKCNTKLCYQATMWLSNELHSVRIGPISRVMQSIHQSSIKDDCKISDAQSNLSFTADGTVTSIGGGCGIYWRKLKFNFNFKNLFY